MRAKTTSLIDRRGVKGVILLALVLGIGICSFTAFSNVAVLSAFAVMLVLTMLRPGGLSYLGFRRQSNWLLLIVSAIVLASIFELGSSILVEPIVASRLGEDIDLSAFAALEGNMVNTGLMLAVGWIVGGFLEEMLFRGFLLQEIERYLGGSRLALGVAIVTTSILFGLPHYYQDVVGMIMTGFVGLLLALTFVWSKRNLWLVILIHGFIDTMGITLIYFGKYDDLRQLLGI